MLTPTPTYMQITYAETHHLTFKCVSSPSEFQAKMRSFIGKVAKPGIVLPLPVCTSIYAMQTREQFTGRPFIVQHSMQSMQE